MGVEAKYVHGYSPREEQRLSEQSGILEELLHGDTRYGPGEKVLEAGCGVGAQTAIMTRRHAGTTFFSLDISLASLRAARQRAGASRFLQGDLLRLPFAEGSFDHVFVCFVLEHLPRPSEALEELRRVLKRGGTLTLIEGDHGSCFWHPDSEDSRRVWRCLIEVQSGMGHFPLIGRRLYPLLRQAGFAVRSVAPRWIYTDANDPEKMDGMVNKIIVPMVQTAREEALRQGMADEERWERGIAELERSGRPPDGTFFYTWFKGVGVKR